MGKYTEPTLDEVRQEEQWLEEHRLHQDQLQIVAEATGRSFQFIITGRGQLYLIGNRHGEIVQRQYKVGTKLRVCCGRRRLEGVVMDSGWFEMTEARIIFPHAEAMDWIHQWVDPKPVTRIHTRNMIMPPPDSSALTIGWVTHCIASLLPQGNSQLSALMMEVFNPQAEIQFQLHQPPEDYKCSLARDSMYQSQLEKTWCQAQGELVLVNSSQMHARQIALTTILQHNVCTKQTTMVVVNSKAKEEYMESHIYGCSRKQLILRASYVKDEILWDSRCSIFSLVWDWKREKRVPEMLDEIADIIRETWRLMDLVLPFNHEKIEATERKEKFRVALDIRQQINERLWHIQKIIFTKPGVIIVNVEDYRRHPLYFPTVPRLIVWDATTFTLGQMSFLLPAIRFDRRYGSPKSNVMLIGNLQITPLEAYSNAQNEPPSSMGKSAMYRLWGPRTTLMSHEKMAEPYRFEL